MCVRVGGVLTQNHEFVVFILEPTDHQSNAEVTYVVTVWKQEHGSEKPAEEEFKFAFDAKSTP